MGKNHRHIEDFLEDQSFRKWILEKDDAEAQYWERWVKSNPNKEQLLLQAKVILLDIAPNIEEWEKHRKPVFLKRLEKSIENIPHQNRRLAPDYSYRERSRRPTVLWPKMVIGGLLFGLFLTALFYETHFFNFQQENLAQEPPVAEDVWIVKSVPSGQKSKLHLSDGSIVTLNSSSQVRYKKGFGLTHRELFLEGEAFFDVASDSLLPFRVITKNIVTTALGTSFNIRNDEDNEIKVQLATGRVEVYKYTETGDGEESLLLKPGEEALSAGQRGLIKQKLDLETAFLWKDGVIYFQKTPFSEVIKTLEKWYGVEIHVKQGSHNNRSVSGEFNNDYLANVLETISYTVEFDYQINGKDVNIFFKNK